MNVEQSLAKQDTAAEAAAEAAADEAAVAEAATEAAAADAEAALHARCDSLFVEQAFAPLLETLTAALLSGRGAPEQLLWRAARACKKLAEAEEDPKSEVRMEHLRDGLEYATRALEAAPELGAAHKWYAILLGTRPGSTADKIKSSFAVKQHFDRAAELARPRRPHLAAPGRAVVLRGGEAVVARAEGGECALRVAARGDLPGGVHAPLPRRAARAWLLRKQPAPARKVLLGDGPEAGGAGLARRVPRDGAARRRRPQGAAGGGQAALLSSELHKGAAHRVLGVDLG